MNEKINKLIKNKDFPPVLFMFGEEEFNLEEDFNYLYQEILSIEHAEFNVDMFDAEEISVERLYNLASSYPFLSEKRFVIVKHLEKLFTSRVSKKNDSLILFEKYLNHPQPCTFLILTAQLDSLNGISADIKNSSKNEKSKKKVESLKAPYSTLLSKHIWVEYPKVYESDFFNFAQNRIKHHGKHATPETIRLLISRCEQNLREIANEIDKLLLFIGDRTDISESDVKNLSGISRNFTVFDLQKYIATKDLPNSIKVLFNILDSERAEMLIISILTRYFIALWKLLEASSSQSNTYQLAAIAGVPHFFINDYLSALKLYQPMEIDKAIMALAEADYSLKSSGSDSLMIMQKLIINIINKDF